MKKVAIVILNWNGAQDTIDCLESISVLRVACCVLRVIVVDNGSIDESVKNIKYQISNIKNINQKLKINLIENRVNLGFAEGNNVGIRFAIKKGADYVMLLNNDTLVEKELVSQLIKLMEEDERIGILGPKIYFAPNFEFHHNRYKTQERGKVIWYGGGKIDWKNVYCSHRGMDEVDKAQYDQQEETDFATGCCMMVRREVFEKIGLLDKRYFLYLEDVDFCLRAKKNGFKVIYTPKAYLWHKNAASSEKPGSKIHQYYQTRNRLYFGLKYAPLRSKLALLRESLKFLVKNGIKRKACLDFYLKRLDRGEFN